MDGRYYWLKLKKDFFKRHDIRILEAMPGGHMSVLFYLKLMLESVDHEGELRFSEKTAYSPEMLATITDTDIETVKTSLERLSELGLVEIASDGTIILEKVKAMIGSASDTDEARRQRRCRERKKSECDKMSRKNVTSVTDSVTKDNESKSKSKSKSKRQSKTNNIYIFVPPSVEEVYQYCESRHNVIDAQLFVDYYQSKNWMVSSGCQMTDWRAAVRAWENNEINYKRGD